MAQDIITGFKDIPFTMNCYTYCYNNPVLLVDRNGMFPSPETITDTLLEWKDTVDNTLDEWAFDVRTDMKKIKPLIIIGEED